MAENQNGFETILTNLALITDGMEALFPSAKTVLIFELSYRDFNSVRTNFKNIKVDENQIKIVISGTEVLFILENSFNEKEVIEEPIVIKETFWKKITKSFFNKGGGPSV
jgi:hypothetical protein